MGYQPSSFTSFPVPQSAPSTSRRLSSPVGFGRFQAISQADICLYHLPFQFSDLGGNRVDKLFKDKNSMTSGSKEAGSVPKAMELLPSTNEPPHPGFKSWLCEFPLNRGNKGGGTNPP